jgi:hypothetical protein
LKFWTIPWSCHLILVATLGDGVLILPQNTLSNNCQTCMNIITSLTPKISCLLVFWTMFSDWIQPTKITSEKILYECDHSLHYILQDVGGVY